MQVTTQLTLLLANKVGTFSAVCRTLSRAGIRIHAFTNDGSADHTVIRLVVDRPSDAIRILETHGALVLEDDVIMIEEANKIGVLDGICEKLAANRVNIEYAYSAASPHNSHGLLILRPNSIAKALHVLNKGKEKSPRKKA